MKNITIIFLIVLSFFVLVFISYIVAFNIYFSSSKLINATKHLSRMTFQRDIKVSGMSFSPFGNFNMRSFSMAAKGGFENGILLNVNKLSAKVNLRRLLRRELHVRSLSVDGIALNLNYENKRKFDYESFFSNIKLIFMTDGKKAGLLKKIEIENIIVANAQINLATDIGDIRFKNISLTSQRFESGGNFDGVVSFDFEYEKHQYTIDAEFNYNSELRVINFSEIKSEGLSLAATGNVNLLQDGNLSLSFTVDADKYFFANILGKISGVNFLDGRDLPPGIVSDVDVEYGFEKI